MLQLSINGAAGRMGQRLITLACQDSAFQLVGAVEATGHPKLGADSGSIAGNDPNGVLIDDQIPSESQVVIDFSQPAGAQRAVDFCHQHRLPLVMATTGLEAETESAIRAAAADIPVVWAPSMSLTVNLTMKLVEMAGKALKDHAAGVDVEIIERHHRYKVDAPSGTALRFGEIAAQAMGLTHHQHGREGITGERPRNEIGYHAVRTGDNAGQHTIVFGMLGEMLELNVAASNRDCYAMGALSAAKFVVNQSPGLFNMYDVLGL